MADLPTRITDAQRPDCPPAEAEDISREIVKEYAPTLDLPDIQEVREGVAWLLEESNTALFKSQFLSDRGFTIEPHWNTAQYHPPKKHPREHVSILEVNEYGIIMQEGDKSRWLERQGNGFEFCRQVVFQTDVIKAIILTSQREVLPFTRLSRDEGQFGWRIARRDSRDKGQKLTGDEEKEVTHLELMLLNSGDEFDIRKRARLHRDSMEMFCKKILWDTLSLDAAPVEWVAKNGGHLAGIYNVPGDTIRLCTEQGYEGDDEIRAVQVVDSMPYVAYGYDDLLYPIRNPRTELFAGGYGYAEPEMIIRAMTNYLNAVNYNAAGLDRNAIPRGILTLFGEYNQRQVAAFTHNLRAMLTGASNRWMLPVMIAKNKESGHVYTPIDQHFDDMLLARWLTFHISMACAMYGREPATICFDSFSTRPSSLSGKDTAERIAASHNKATLSNLFFLSTFYDNLLLIENPKWRFEYTGLEEENEEHRQARIMKTWNVNEIREIDGADPCESEIIGEAPADPSLHQLYMMELQASGKLQPPDMMGGGMGGPGGGDGEEYPQDGGGQHLPYRDDKGGQPPGGEHLHTIELESSDGGGAGKGQKKPPIAKALLPGRHVRRVGNFMVVVEPER
jgi:hypothetical protein